MKKLKIVFAGTAYFSAEHLKALITSSHRVILVISQPDLPSGRGQKTTFSSVKKISLNYNIPICQPIRLDDPLLQNKLLQLHADIMIVVSYGKIIPKNILNIFPLGCINVHPSLLPRWRGATPIQSAILYGDTETGISIIKMNEKIDSGSIIHTIKCNISYQDTAYSLSLKLIKIGIKALLESLEMIIANTVIYKNQNKKKVVLSKKIYKKDGLLNLHHKAEILERLVRAFNPWPICYLVIQNQYVKIWKTKVLPIVKKHAHIGEIILANNDGIQINTSYQILNIEKLQFPGKNITEVRTVLFSKKELFKPGTII